MDSKDEFVHSYPKPLDAPWKENWYFNFIDRPNRAWGIHHISLMRDLQKGRFSAFHVVDDEILMHSNLIEIDDDLMELTDGRLRVEFVEPFKRFRLSFDGPQHQVELDFEARFDVFDYAMARPSRPGKEKPFVLNHYEQALFARGRIRKDGRSRPIECFGHRDHSWGYRNESKISKWNWAAIQMQDRTVNLSKVVIQEAFLASGFVSNRTGNTRIVGVTIDQTDFENDVPVSSVFTAEDQAGKTWRFRSEKFSGLYLPMEGRPGGVVVHENFAEYTDLDTGEKGIGIDEYLINPLSAG
jgi:hypothetical protein